MVYCLKIYDRLRVLTVEVASQLFDSSGEKTVRLGEETGGFTGVGRAKHNYGSGFAVNKLLDERLHLGSVKVICVIVGTIELINFAWVFLSELW